MVRRNMTTETVDAQYIIYLFYICLFSVQNGQDEIA